MPHVSSIGAPDAKWIFMYKDISYTSCYRPRQLLAGESYICSSCSRGILTICFRAMQDSRPGILKQSIKIVAPENKIFMQSLHALTRLTYFMSQFLDTSSGLNSFETSTYGGFHVIEASTPLFTKKVRGTTEYPSTEIMETWKSAYGMKAESPCGGYLYTDDNVVEYVEYDG